VENIQFKRKERKPVQTGVVPKDAFGTVNPFIKSRDVWQYYVIAVGNCFSGVFIYTFYFYFTF